MTVCEKGLEAALEAYVANSRKPWRDAVYSILTAYLSARSAEPVAEAPTKKAVDIPKEAGG